MGFSTSGLLVWLLAGVITLFGSHIIHAQNARPAKLKPIEIGQEHEVYSTALKEKRKLNIYLPEGYKPGDTTRYPVVYLLDGGMDEDFLHTIGLLQFNAMPWVNHAPPCIVVGVVNVDRKRDFTFPTSIKEHKEKWPTTGSSAAFISFLESELLTFISKQYKTNGSNTIVGQSLGGLLACQVLLSKPALFSNYLITSPSLWWDNGALLKRKPNFDALAPGQKLNIYVAVGKEGLAPTAEPHVMEVDANVLVDSLKTLNNKHLRIYLDYLPAEDHATIGHQALMNGFRFLFNKQ